MALDPSEDRHPGAGDWLCAEGQMERANAGGELTGTQALALARVGAN